MLARLEGQGGIERAEIDFAGEHLRLSVSDNDALAPALELLVSLGYGAEQTADEPKVPRWYDVRSIGELSRVEADVIAERVASRFVDAQPSAAGAAARLRVAVADALHACFVATTLGAGPSSIAFRLDCVDKAVAAVTPIVGAVPGSELGRLLDHDLGQVHRPGRS